MQDYGLQELSWHASPGAVPAAAMMHGQLGRNQLQWHEADPGCR